MTVAVSITVWTLGAFVLSPTGFEEMREEMGEHGARVQMLTSAGFLLVDTVLRVVLAFRMRAGRNWARLVLTALGALGMLLVLTTMGMGGFDGETVTEYIDELPLSDSVLTLLDACVIVLMFLPTANAYFSTRSVRGTRQHPQ
ncbi:hypothetical protein [Streptomyces sp. NPDC003393]